MLSKAIGEGGRNVQAISRIIKKRLRIIPIPNGIEHAKSFIKAIVNPVEFQDLEIGEDEIVLTAGRQSKAALLGRNKKRLEEMQDIVRDLFRREFRIV